ncbi:MAG TPA: hypothetical protein VGM93_02300, partial [Acidimicrobiales bacterium]
ILDKRISVEGTLYGGSVSNPRELQALQDELASLARRAGQLEDQIIELMEQVEPLDAELAQIAQQGDAGQDELIRLEAAVVQEEADIAAELVSEGELRAAAVDGIPESLLKEYDSLRGPSGGVAIARLEGSQCGACHLALSSMQVARLHKLPPDEAAHCDECDRLLVP